MINHKCNHPPSYKVQQLAAALLGTTGGTTLDEQIEELTTEECEEFDDIVFNCERCNWWCSTEELNDETGMQLCDDCQAEEDGA
jgi:hypothetical protein